jgi:hypothetical protein
MDEGDVLDVIEQQDPYISVTVNDIPNAYGG